MPIRVAVHIWGRPFLAAAAAGTLTAAVVPDGPAPAGVAAAVALITAAPAVARVLFPTAVRSGWPDPVQAALGRLVGRHLTQLRTIDPDRADLAELRLLTALGVVRRVGTFADPLDVATAGDVTFIPTDRGHRLSFGYTSTALWGAQDGTVQAGRIRRRVAWDLPTRPGTAGLARMVGRWVADGHPVAVVTDVDVVAVHPVAGDVAVVVRAVDADAPGWAPPAA